jgi:hypothetical protein
LENRRRRVPKALVARLTARNVATPTPCGRVINVHRRISNAPSTNSRSRRADPVERMFKMSTVVVAVGKIVVELSDERKQRMIVKIIQADVTRKKQPKINLCFHFGSRIIPSL